MRTGMLENLWVNPIFCGTIGTVKLGGLMKYGFDSHKLKELDLAHLPEWVMTCGNGGFSAGSVYNSCFRKQHGYLVISKKSPINRFLVLTRTDETVKIGKNSYSLVSQKYNDHMEEGHRYLDRFDYDGVPTFTYAVEDALVVKTIAPDYGHNTVAIRYVVTAGATPVKLTVTPLINHRPHADVALKTDLVFSQLVKGSTVTVVPSSDRELSIYFNCSSGVIDASEPTIETGFVYDFETRTGDLRSDCHYRPFTVDLEVAKESILEFGLVVSTEEMPEKTAKTIITDYRLRQDKLVEHALSSDPFTQNLILAADQFIAHRQSTDAKTILAGLPWFTDWGRDTMIAFPGLCLATKRYKEAKEILISFATYVKNGLIPNMFPDDGMEPLYNTVDASLWYFQAANQYIEATGDSSVVREILYPCFKKIIDAYQNGTAFSIKMDDDGLISAGSGLDQVTWMDVRIKGVVVTPRHGKPVEINALWYNALMIMADLSNRFGMDGNPYKKLASQVEKSFNKKFWNSKTQCLFDVVDPIDASIRPNQLYALSLTHPVITGAKARSIVEVAEKELLDVYGMRTLSQFDPRFKPVYEGDIESRDFAYHMGTTWPFLLGAYLDAYMLANHSSPKAKQYVKELCERFDVTMHEGCLNGISELFDGLGGKISKGCYTQAWSVGEILRIYTKYKLSER